MAFIWNVAFSLEVGLLVALRFSKIQVSFFSVSLKNVFQFFLKSFWRQLVTKIVILAPHTTLFNVGRKFPCSIFVSTAWHTCSRLDTTLNHWERVLGIVRHAVHLFRILDLIMKIWRVSIIFVTDSSYWNQVFVWYF